MGLTCSPGLILISQNSLIFLIVSGQFSVVWSQLIAPTVDWSILGALLSLIVGAILLILSLGITFGFSIQALATGASASFGGGHEQGGKLLQAIGIGMLIWGMTLSTIGGWETYLDGISANISTLFNILLELAFCLGIVWQSQVRH